jgi:hypothetical protein
MLVALFSLVTGSSMIMNGNRGEDSQPSLDELEAATHQLESAKSNTILSQSTPQHQNHGAASIVTTAPAPLASKYSLNNDSGIGSSTSVHSMTNLPYNPPVQQIIDQALSNFASSSHSSTKSTTSPHHQSKENHRKKPSKKPRKSQQNIPNSSDEQPTVRVPSIPCSNRFASLVTDSSSEIGLG